MAQDVVSPGQDFVVRIANTGEACLSCGHARHLERELPDGTWQNVWLPYAWPDVIELLEPGQAVGTGVTVPTDAPAGRYRLRVPSFGSVDGDPAEVAIGPVPFRVVVLVPDAG